MESSTTNQTEIKVELDQEAQLALSLSDEERKYYIAQGCFVFYPVAEKALRNLERCFHHPLVTRMPCRLLVGDTNNGKTRILEKLVSEHPKEANPEGEHIIYPIVYINAPKKPDEGRLYDNILDSINAEYSPESKPEKKRKVVYDLLRTVQTKMLIIDEIHNMSRGTGSQQSDFRVLLKTLSNELKLPIILAGTEEAYNVIQVDDQTTNRFVPIYLPKWDYGLDYFDLLNGFERNLPLKKTSYLAYNEKLALKILARTDGLLGEISDLLKEAAILAIESGTEKITLKLLDEVDRPSPQDRRNKGLFTKS